MRIKTFFSSDRDKRQNNWFKSLIEYKFNFILCDILLVVTVELVLELLVVVGEHEES